MCTYVDENATENFKKNNKGKKRVFAWKVVRINMRGEYESPFERSLISIENSISEKSKKYFYCSAIYDGAFHLSSFDFKRKSSFN